MKIETPKHFRQARERLGLNRGEMGRRLRLTGARVDKTVGNIENANHSQPLTGPICVATEYMLQDWTTNFDAMPTNGDPFDVWDSVQRVRIPDCYWNDVAKQIVSPYLPWSGKASHWRPSPMSPDEPDYDE